MFVLVDSWFMSIYSFIIPHRLPCGLFLEASKLLRMINYTGARVSETGGIIEFLTQDYLAPRQLRWRGRPTYVRRSCSAKVAFLSDCIILLTLAVRWLRIMATVLKTALSKEFRYRRFCEFKHSIPLFDETCKFSLKKKKQNFKLHL